MADQKHEWVNWLNTQVLQKAVVVDEEGNLLCLRRSETGPASRLGKWDLLGGSIGPEDLVDGAKPNIEAIIREIKEETSLEVQGIVQVYLDSWVSHRSVGKILGIAIGYKTTVRGIKPNVTLSHEHIESKWCAKQEALSLDFGDDGGLHSSIIMSL